MASFSCSFSYHFHYLSLTIVVSIHIQMEPILANRRRIVKKIIVIYSCKWIQMFASETRCVWSEGPEFSITCNRMQLDIFFTMYLRTSNENAFFFSSEAYNVIMILSFMFMKKVVSLATTSLSLDAKNRLQWYVVSYLYNERFSVYCVITCSGLKVF